MSVQTFRAPSLATSWDISEDGLTYTFHLREGVKFHTTDYFKPTRDFNADDVLFTYQRMLDRNHPFRQAYPSEFPYFTDMGLDKNIAKIEKTDDMTVVFTLNAVDAAFVQNLAMNFAAIHSAEYADQLLKAGKAAEINQKPIGTGPFVFSRYQKDAVIRFKGNTQYWAPENATSPSTRALPTCRVCRPTRISMYRPSLATTSATSPTTSPARRSTNAKCARRWTWP